MKGLIRHSVLGTGLSAALALLTGCVPEYRDLVDPCWPERYNSQARHSVRDTFNAQAANGHVLDQTVWNQHFDKDTDKLTDQGKEHLKYLARRRPTPDPKVYVQTSHDAKGDRTELDQRRVAAVQNYLSGLLASKSGGVTNFDILVHDAPEPGLRVRPAPSVYVRPASGGTITGQTPTTVGVGGGDLGNVRPTTTQTQSDQTTTTIQR